MSDSLHPMDYSPPGSSVHGLLQARVLEWVVSLSIHLLIGCFPILAIKNKTARNVGVKSKGQNPELWPAGPALLLALWRPAGP